MFFSISGLSTGEEEVEEHINLEELKVLSANSPKTLRPAAADAYLMFQVGKPSRFSLHFTSFLLLISVSINFLLLI